MTAFDIGALTVIEIVENDLSVDMAQAFRGLDSDEGTLDRLRESLPGSLFDRVGHPLLIFRSYVLRTESAVLILDTCWGNYKERPFAPHAHMLETGYLANMAAAGVEPAEVDYVFCTHLHQDHVGWNTRRNFAAAAADIAAIGDSVTWVPTFPNATYLFVREEYEHWASIGPASHDHDAFRDSVEPIVGAGRHRFIEPGHVIDLNDAIVRVEPLLGHTPGHCGLHVESRGERAVFSGDLFHVAYQFSRPDWHIAIDHDVAQALATRLNFLDRYADSGTRVVPAHFNAAAGGYIERRESTFGFAPA